MIDKAIDWWFRSVVWPFGEWSGLDDFQSQAALTGGLTLWVLAVAVGVIGWRMQRKKFRTDSA